MNHQTSSPKRKRESVEQHSRDSSLKNFNMEPNESKFLRLSARIQDLAGEDEMSFRNSPSPTPMSFFDHSNHPSLLSNKTPELTCLDPEVRPRLGDSELITSIIPQQNTSPMDVDTPTSSQLLKPVRRMLFKPNLPGRRNQPTVQTSTHPTSNSAEPLSTSLSVSDGHSKKDELEVTSRAQDVVLLSPRPRLPLPSKKCTPTPPSPLPRHHGDAQKIAVPDTRVSLSKDEDFSNATDTDPDAEIVDLLLRGTPEEHHNSNCLSDPLQQEIIEDLSHGGHEDKDVKDVESSVWTVEDTAAVEGLATQFLQRSVVTLFSFEEYSIVLTYVAFSMLRPGTYSYSMWIV